MSEVLIMNKEQMVTLKRDFLARAEQVQELRNGLQRTLDGTTWDGRRAREFRQLWVAEFAPNLVKLEQALRENGRFIGKERANAITAMDS